MLQQSVLRLSLRQGLIAWLMSASLAHAEPPPPSPAASPQTVAPGGQVPAPAEPGSAPAGSPGPGAPAAPPPGQTPAPATQSPPPLPPAAAPPPAAPPGYEFHYAAVRDPGRERAQRPLILDYVDGDPVPAGFTVVRRRRKGLVIAGSILLGISYGISLAVAAGNEYSQPWGWLALPVLGPVIASTQIDDCNSEDEFDCDEENSQRGFLMFDTLVQAAGTAMLIVGLTVDKKVMIQNMAVDFSLRPLVAQRSGGLNLVGAF